MASQVLCIINVNIKMFVRFYSQFCICVLLNATSRWILFKQHISFGFLKEICNTQCFLLGKLLWKYRNLCFFKGVSPFLCFYSWEERKTSSMLACKCIVKESYSHLFYWVVLFANFTFSEFSKKVWFFTKMGLHHLKKNL